MIHLQHWALTWPLNLEAGCSAALIWKIPFDLETKDSALNAWISPLSGHCQPFVLSSLKLIYHQWFESAKYQLFYINTEILNKWATCIEVMIRLFVDIKTIIRPTNPIKFSNRNLCSEGEKNVNLCEKSTFWHHKCQTKVLWGDSCKCKLHM